MTAVTVTRPRSSEIVRDAHAVLHVAMELPDRAKVADEIIALADVLDAYAEIEGGEISSVWAFPDLRDEEDPDTEALRRVAERVETAAEALVEAIRQRRGITAGGDAGTEDGMKNAAGVTA